MLSRPKDRKIAALLALFGVIPLPLPGLVTIAGLHKFYLGQSRWGVVYLLLSFTPIPAVASAIEAMWYLFQDNEEFQQNFNAGLNPGLNPGLGQSPSAGVVGAAGGKGATIGPPVQMMAEALRELDDLRQEGLISEYEFEQKRRQVLERMG